MSEDLHPIVLGSSGWSYPDWEGPFYPEGLPAGDYLEYYADRFPAVEVDSTFYRPPTPAMVRAWARRTPEDFRFVLKVPRIITHEKGLQDCGEEVDGFLSSIAGLGPKMAACLLQMGYFNRSAFASQDEFLDVLDSFLDAWPTGRVPLAVEIRNNRWMTAEFADVLRKHGAALTLTEQVWMPRPSEILGRFDPITGPLSVVRLLGDREGIEKITQTWGSIVVDREEELRETAEVARALATRAPVYVFASNHYAGHSPETLRTLRSLLNLPEPVPPERPRTTLFD